MFTKKVCRCLTQISTHDSYIYKIVYTFVGKIKKIVGKIHFFFVHFIHSFLSYHMHYRREHILISYSSKIIHLFSNLTIWKLWNQRNDKFYVSIKHVHMWPANRLYVCMILNGWRWWWFGTLVHQQTKQ